MAELQLLAQCLGQLSQDFARVQHSIADFQQVLFSIAGQASPHAHDRLSPSNQHDQELDRASQPGQPLDQRAAGFRSAAEHASASIAGGGLPLQDRGQPPSSLFLGHHHHPLHRDHDQLHRHRHMPMQHRVSESAHSFLSLGGSSSATGMDGEAGDNLELDPLDHHQATSSGSATAESHDTLGSLLSPLPPGSAGNPFEAAFRDPQQQPPQQQPPRLSVSVPVSAATTPRQHSQLQSQAQQQRADPQSLAGPHFHHHQPPPSQQQQQQLSRQRAAHGRRMTSPLLSSSNLPSLAEDPSHSSPGSATTTTTAAAAAAAGKPRRATADAAQVMEGSAAARLEPQLLPPPAYESSSDDDDRPQSRQQQQQADSKDNQAPRIRSLESSEDSDSDSEDGDPDHERKQQQQQGTGHTFEAPQVQTRLRARSIRRRRRLQQAELQQKVQAQRAEDMYVRRENVVVLNVGGQRFRTTKSTLCMRQSMFQGLLSGHFGRAREDTVSGGSALASTGAAAKEPEELEYFIDRDPTLFHHILNYLRDGAVFLEELGRREKRALLREARFFAVPHLMHMLEADHRRQQSLERRELSQEKEYKLVTNVPPSLLRSVMCFFTIHEGYDFESWTFGGPTQCQGGAGCVHGTLAANNSGGSGGGGGLLARRRNSSNTQINIGNNNQQQQLQQQQNNAGNGQGLGGAAAAGGAAGANLGGAGGNQGAGGNLQAGGGHVGGGGLNGGGGAAGAGAQPGGAGEAGAADHGGGPALFVSDYQNAVRGAGLRVMGLRGADAQAQQGLLEYLRSQGREVSAQEIGLGHDGLGGLGGVDQQAMDSCPGRVQILFSKGITKGELRLLDRLNNGT